MHTRNGVFYLSFCIFSVRILNKFRNFDFFHQNKYIQALAILIFLRVMLALNRIYLVWRIGCK